MPITSKEAQAGLAPARRELASLIGAFVIAVGCLILWLLVAAQLSHATPGPAMIAGGAVVTTAIAAWIRLADM
jgi:hypothetical protein